MLPPMLLAFALSSPDFKDGAAIPKAFAFNQNGCGGENRTPRVRWDAVPPGTRTFSLTVVDHDAAKPGGWTHWAVFRLPANTRALGDLPVSGAVILRNSFGTLGWGGPCPPPGSVHHYTFELRALDAHDRTVGIAKMVPVYSR
jgi:Raf kinase inhibitor-like YbhB/YbcL family protein